MNISKAAPRNSFTDGLPLATILRQRSLSSSRITGNCYILSHFMSSSERDRRSTIERLVESHMGTIRAERVYDEAVSKRRTGEVIQVRDVRSVGAFDGPGLKRPPAVPESIRPLA